MRETRMQLGTISMNDGNERESRHSLRSCGIRNVVDEEREMMRMMIVERA